MDKLDENYLNLVRESLYKKQLNSTTKPIAAGSKNYSKSKRKAGDNEVTPKNKVQKGFKTKKETFKAKAKLEKVTKKKAKPKQVVFDANTSGDKPESSSSNASPNRSSSKIKNRVATPFKILEAQTKRKTKSKSPNLNAPQDGDTVVVENTSGNKPESSSYNASPKRSSSKIKNRVATPFKILEAPANQKTKSKLPNLIASQDGATVVVAAKLSPSLHEIDIKEANKKINNYKSKKRLLSESDDSPKEHVKRKKGKPFANKGKKLLFDDGPDDFEGSKASSNSPDIHQNKKVMSKKKKVKNKAVKKDVQTMYSLDTSLQSVAVPNLNNTWENFIYSLKNEKDKEKAEEPKKRAKIKKSNGDKSPQNFDIIELDSSGSYQTSNLVIEKSSKGLVKGTADKKSDYKNGKRQKKAKKLNLKNKVKNSFKKVSISDDSSSSSDIEFKPLKGPKKTSSIVDDSAEFSDSCDNETVGVKGLKFQRFCNLFPPTHNEQFLGYSSPLSIPKKYFNISENDSESEWSYEDLPSRGKKRNNSRSQRKTWSKTRVEDNLIEKEVSNREIAELSDLDNPNGKVSENDFELDWQCEKLHSQRHQKRGNLNGQKEISNKNDFKNNLIDQEVPLTEVMESGHLENSNKKEQRKKINILDVQVLSPKSQDVTVTRDQKTAKETSNSQEVSIESVNQKVTNEETDSYSEESSERQPVILTLKNKNKVVVLHLGDQIYFHGLCLIKVLNGEVEILGATINRNSGEKKVYSPRGTALLYIRNHSTLYVNNLIELKHLISEELLYESDVKLTFHQHCAIFLCSELRDIYIDFTERYISQKIFPESDDQAPRLDFKLQGSWNKTQFLEKWEDILENIPQDSKIVVAGGKGVGKSTFLRYALNFMLRKFEKVRVIDLDPGQSEFYPPGCISVVTVAKEVFGPNYTHLLEPDSLILSHINMSFDINKYLKSVKHLLDSTRSMDPLPTLLNFPGFTQGLGLYISAESVKLVQPTSVIQINSKNPFKNYKVDLTTDNVNRVLKDSDILSQDESDDHGNLAYDFVKFESLAESNEAWSLEARQGREINILAYFGKLMSENVSDFKSADINIYSINISALHIVNLEGKVISPLAINANLVALCSKLDKNSDIFSCYGYGFVRGIDLKTGTLVLITPETIQTLGNVSHLVLSSVTAPPSLIMTADSVKGHIPYVSAGDPINFGQFTKRSYIPPKK